MSESESRGLRRSQKCSCELLTDGKVILERDWQDEIARSDQLDLSPLGFSERRFKE